MHRNTPTPIHFRPNPNLLISPYLRVHAWLRVRVRLHQTETSKNTKYFLAIGHLTSSEHAHTLHSRVLLPLSSRHKSDWGLLLKVGNFDHAFLSVQLGYKNLFTEDPGRTLINVSKKHHLVEWKLEVLQLHLTSRYGMLSVATCNYNKENNLAFPPDRK